MVKQQYWRWLIEAGSLVLLSAAFLVSIAVTARALWLSHAYLPTDDLLWYGVWLARAAAGEVDWNLLQESHNGVHQVALLKLLCLLDVWLVRGTGWFVIGASAACLLAAQALILVQVYRLPDWQTFEKHLLALFLAVYALGAVQLDTLARPAALWSPLVLLIVLTAVGLQAWAHGSRRGLALALVASVASLFSAGSAVLLIVAWVAVWAGTRSDTHLLRQHGFAMLSGLFLVCGVAYGFFEWVNHAVWQGDPLLYRLTRYLLEPEMREALVRTAGADPWQYQWRWLGQSLQAFVNFWSIPLDAFMHEAILLPTLVVLAGLAGHAIYRRWFPENLRVLALYILVFVLGFSLLGSIFRGWLGADMQRFASLSLMASSVLWVWIVSGLRQWLPRPLLCLLLVCLAGLALYDHAQSAARFVADRHAQRVTQVVYAVGSEDDRAIITSGMLPTAGRDIEAVRRFSPLWRSAGLGVFASRPYRVFAGEQPLPEHEVDCHHEPVFVRPYRWDAQAFRARGRSTTASGKVLDRVLIRTTDGRHLGYGIPWMPEGLSSQWQNGQDWFAYWRFPESVEPVVSVIAYDKQVRCRPWQWGWR